MLIKIARLFIVLLGMGTDVITVSTGTAGLAGNVAASLSTYLSAKLLDVAELKTVFKQLGEVEAFPANSGKTIRFTRQEKFTVSTAPAQLTEGIPPAAQGLTLNQFEATAEQYAYLTILSDLARLTAKHPIVEQNIFNLGLHLAETYDMLIFNVLNTGNTNVYYPNNRTADTSLLATDRIGYEDIVNIAAKLSVAGANTYADGQYAVVIAPMVHASLQTDPDLVN